MQSHVAFHPPSGTAVVEKQGWSYSRYGLSSYLFLVDLEFNLGLQQGPSTVLDSLFNREHSLQTQNAVSENKHTMAWSYSKSRIPRVLKENKLALGSEQKVTGNKLFSLLLMEWRGGQAGGCPGGSWHNTRYLRTWRLALLMVFHSIPVGGLQCAESTSVLGSKAVYPWRHKQAGSHTDFLFCEQLKPIDFFL